MNELLVPARSQQEVNDARTAIAKLLGVPGSGTANLKAMLAEGDPCKDEHALSDALYSASGGGWLWMVEVLLRHKADVGFAKRNGAHPLYIACKGGHTDCARALVAARANPNQLKAGGWSPLLLAVQSNHVECVRVLIQARADVDHSIEPIADNRGMTTCAVMHACIGAAGHAESLALLLEARADPDRACAASGRTALSSACEFGWIDCAILLESYGARRWTTRDQQVRLQGGRVVTRKEDVDQLIEGPDSKGMGRWVTDTSDWVTPLHFWPVVPLERIRQLLRDGCDVHARLELPVMWKDARRHSHPSPMADARAWLAGQRAAALWPSQAEPPRPAEPSAVEGRIDPAHVTAAATLLVEASEWSPKTHRLFPPQMRARACDLLWLGHLLARSLEARGEAAAAAATAAADAVGVAARSPHFAAVALLDVWRDHIMPHALRRDETGTSIWYCPTPHPADGDLQRLSFALYRSSRRPARWLPGTTVELRGIRSASHAHLNGTVGTSTAHCPSDGGRWPIRTRDGTVIHLKPENLAPAGLKAFRAEPAVPLELEPRLDVCEDVQPSDAERDADAAKARRGKAQFVYEQGSAAWRGGEHERALVLVTQAIDAYAPDPAPSEYYVNRAALYKDHLERLEEALADAERAVELDPKWIGVHITLGAVLQNMCARGANRWVEARAAYARALAIDQNDAEVLHNLKVLTAEEAKQRRAKRVATVPEAAETCYQQGIDAYQQGEYARGVELYTAAIDACAPALAPAEYYRSRSSALTRRGKYEEALADAGRTIELKPDWGGGYATRADILTVMCRQQGASLWAEAREAYEHVLHLDPTHREVKRIIVMLRVEEARALATASGA